MAMNIELTPELEELIKQRLESGLYSSATAVVHEALLRLGEADRAQERRHDQLRMDILEGVDSGTPVCWDPEEFKRLAREQRAVRGGGTK